MTATPPPSFPPDLRLPSLDGLRAFEAAARLGTFERAADELSITASAVGKRIGALEELLGVALLQRGAKSLTLSAVGKEYLVQVRSALSLLAAMPLHQRTEQRKQRLRLSAPPTFARQVLVPALPEFGEQHPAIELEVVLSVPFLDLAGADAELAVRHGPVDPNGLSSLWRDHLVPLASPALLCAEDLRAPADLARVPLLRTPVDPWLPWFRAQGLDWPEPDQGPRLIDLGLVLEAARCGQGVVLARPALARQWLSSGELRPVFGAGRTPMLQADTAYHVVTVATPTPATLALSNWLHDVGARAAAEGLSLVSGPA